MLTKLGQQMLTKLGQQMLTKIDRQLFHTIETDGRLAGAKQQMFLTYTIDYVTPDRFFCVSSCLYTTTCVHLSLTSLPSPCGRHKWMTPYPRLSDNRFQKTLNCDDWSQVTLSDYASTGKRLLGLSRIVIDLNIDDICRNFSIGEKLLGQSFRLLVRGLTMVPKTRAKLLKVSIF